MSANITTMKLLSSRTEVTNQECFCGIGCPFSIYDIIIRLHMEAIYIVSLLIISLVLLRGLYAFNYFAELVKTALCLV
jgi:hypothetical protein